MPADFVASLQFLSYGPGSEYGMHADCMSVKRAATVMIFLSDDYTGGESIFPYLRIKVVGTRGRLLFFENLGP